MIIFTITETTNHDGYQVYFDQHLKLIFHRYGTDAAAVADAAFATAGNSYLTFYNTAALGPKSIAKRAAKVIWKLT